VTERRYPVNEAALGVDQGAARDTRTRPCCERITGSWCVLPAGHDGEHNVAPPRKAG